MIVLLKSLAVLLVLHGFLPSQQVGVSDWTPPDPQQQQRLCDAMERLRLDAIPRLEAQVANLRSVDQTPRIRAMRARLEEALELSRNALRGFHQLKAFPGGIRVGPDAMREFAFTEIEEEEYSAARNRTFQYGSEVQLLAESVTFAPSVLECPGSEGEVLLAALLVHEQFRREQTYCRPAGDHVTLLL